MFEDILLAHRTEGASRGFDLCDELLAVELARFEGVSQSAYLTLGSAQSVEHFLMVRRNCFFCIHMEECGAM